jgi:hypothetical protein
MPGVLREPKYINDVHKTAMTAQIDKENLDDKLRRKGLI